MKKSILLFFIFIYQFTFGQDTISIYLKKNKFKLVKTYLSHSKYKAKIDGVWKEVLLRENGTIISLNSYKDKPLKKRIGMQKSFHENGSLRLLRYYNENSKLDGKYLTFRNDGVKSIIGNYKDGKRIGVWNFYYKNGNKKARILYKNGDIVKYNLWFENGDVKDEKLIFERRARFLGEESRKSLPKYIQKKLIPKLPVINTKGTIYIKFTVNIKGRPENITILPSTVSKDVRKIIFDLFKEMPDWEPGIQLNNKVPIKYTFPLRIR